MTKSYASNESNPTHSQGNAGSAPIELPIAGRGYKAGRLTYIGNAALSPPPGTDSDTDTDTSPGRRGVVMADSSWDGLEKSLNSPKNQCSIGFQPVFFGHRAMFSRVPLGRRAILVAAIAMTDNMTAYKNNALAALVSIGQCRVERSGTKQLRYVSW